MTEALFLAELDAPAVGAIVRVTGEEGHHAVAVRRVRVGEAVLVSDGLGNAVRGRVVSADKAGLAVRVDDVLHSPETALRFVAYQALAKGDRAEMAVEAMTEVGVHEVVAWNAARSEVRWAADRASKALSRWASKAREAAKQSRRFRVPAVSGPASTRALLDRVEAAALTLVLHESATQPLWEVPLPASGEIVLVIGPEGGLTDAELDALVASGGRVVTVCDAVLRTSTAGVVALAQLTALAASARRAGAARG
jgi:16S rRNA (uracil1498-N3)-methyltransferase